jgi:hypothetical protein
LAVVISVVFRVLFSVVPPVVSPIVSRVVMRAVFARDSRDSEFRVSGPFILYSVYYLLRNSLRLTMRGNLPIFEQVMKKVWRGRP